MLRVLLLALALVPLCRAKEPMDVSSDLEALIKGTEVPGLAVAAVRNGEIVATGAAGVRKLGAPEKVTLNDHFHIGSCTKSMTASLAAMIVADGKITWDTKAADVFKDVAVHPDFRAATLRELLSNTGGAPHEAPKELWGQLSLSKAPEAEQRRLLVTAVLTEKPAYPPGQGSTYSNQGFTIGGAMLEKVTGQPYDALLQKRLFAPLGITTAGFGAAATPGKIDQPYGHRLVAGKLVAIDPAPHGDNPSAISPAGRVNLSILDFAKYASFHLGDYKNGPLDAKQLADLHQPVAPSPDYACGWAVAQRDWAGGTALNHSGSNTMNFAVMWLAPAKDFAVVVACNSGEGAKVCDQAASLLITRCLKE